MNSLERTLYPELEPFHTSRLEVGNGHTLHVEQAGNPEGAPVVYVHGGPGGGTHPNFRRYFDPDHYRIILFDQRGCGRSTPGSSLDANTTWHLVADMELVRASLGIGRWHLFGGSWGSTLALAYAQKHRMQVASMVMRSVFLGRRREVDWLFGGGAGVFFPEEWLRFSHFVPEAERSDLVRAYYRRLVSPDAELRIKAARNWCEWETSLLHLSRDDEKFAELGQDQALHLARIEAHYFANNCFLKQDEQILRDSVLLRQIPAIIVQGRYDMITPPRSAFELKKRWPEAELRIATLAGHASSERWLIHHLVEATDAMRGVNV